MSLPIKVSHQVWLINGNKVITARVVEIVRRERYDFVTTKVDSITEYKILVKQFDDTFYYVSDGSDIFQTKKELIESL